jgi:hypothetical protein
MRLGCLGCLGTSLSLVALLSLVGAGIWAWSRAWTPPSPLVGSQARTETSGLERKLAELTHRSGNRATLPESIVLSEAEVSALAARLLEDAGLLTSSFSTEMREGRAVVQWRGPVGGLLQGPPFGWLAAVLTQPMGRSPIWITLAGDVQLQSASKPGRPRYAEVRVASARVGSLPVPGWLLTLMAGPRGAALLRWPVPATVDRLELGDGRLTIRTR